MPGGYGVRDNQGSNCQAEATFTPQPDLIQRNVSPTHGEYGKDLHPKYPESRRRYDRKDDGCDGKFVQSTSFRTSRHRG